MRRIIAGVIALCVLISIVLLAQFPEPTQEQLLAPTVATRPAPTPTVAALGRENPTRVTVGAKTTRRDRNRLAIASAQVTRAWTWDMLADCESGAWDRDRNPIPGSAHWDDRRAGYEGGVHFAPSTWDANRPADFPPAAYLATREEQIVVAERVLAGRPDGGAWPTCSRKIGMR